MTRPPAKTAVRALPAPSAPAVAVSAPATAALDNPVDNTPFRFTAPSLQLFTPEDKFLGRYWRQAAITIVAIAIIAYMYLATTHTSGVSSDPSAVQPALADTWSHASIAPHGRSLSVYEASRDGSDYRLEFAWVPDGKGVGWVMRMRDSNNYYATRLTLVEPGANLVLAEEHFSVVGGAERPHTRKVIPVANSSGLVRVRMNASGSAFTLSLQDTPVDDWNDVRLDSGALGFYDDRGQRPEVQDLRFTLIQKGASRSAAAILP